MKANKRGKLQQKMQYKFMGLLLMFYLVFHTQQTAINDLPEQFSWANKDGKSYLSYVHNQNFPQVCNSGWAISSTTALNARIKIRRNGQSPDISLSPQVLLSCDQLDQGCLGGQPLTALKWISKNNITDESCQTYQAKGYTNGLKCDSQAKCRICFDGKCKGQARSKIYSINKYGIIAGQQSMMLQIQKNGPIPCGIATTDGFKNYTKGIYRDSSVNKKMDHFVTIYGWGQQNGTKFWNAMNSWGSAWGQNGHFRIIKGQNNLGIQQRCYWSDVADTWTKDVRNETLPDAFQLKKHQKLQAHQNIKNQIIPKFLAPSRGSSNLNSCDSSWAFAVVNMLTDRDYNKNNGSRYLMFSVQSLLNCGVGTCEKGGDPLNALLFIHKYGVAEQSCQNYQAHTPEKESCSNINNCATCKGTIFNSKCQEVKTYRRWKIFDYGTISGSDSMKGQLNWGPIVCGIHATQKFKAYTGGVFTEYSVLTKPNHYVQVIGYGEQNGNSYWKIRNSWGTAWGESGFGKVLMKQNNLGIENTCYWGNNII